MDIKHVDLAMPMILYRKLEKEKARRIPTVPIRHLILEALADRYLNERVKA